MNDVLYIGQEIILAPEISLQLAEFERRLKEIKEQEETIKQKILEAMEENNVVKLDTPDLSITYIAPTDRETFDTKTFRSENPEVYDAYVKMTPVKSTIRIKLK